MSYIETELNIVRIVVDAYKLGRSDILDEQKREKEHQVMKDLIAQMQKPAAISGVGSDVKSEETSLKKPTKK